MTKPSIPSEGGSFVVGKGGKLEKREGTLGPLDPQHETNRPKGTAVPPAPAGPKQED